ncbi:MAG: hypothetical protein GY868_14085, partial [Deltaproteobacteria bacterium]|nr:hypothetical protein [Deltaproteobacteria bacterium]
MKLFEPGRIGNVEIKNRVLMAPMGAHGLHDQDGDWGARLRAYYEARAAGGTGMITTEMVFVSDAVESIAKDLFNLYNEKHFQSLGLLAEALHAHGCRLSVQLT